MRECSLTENQQAQLRRIFEYVMTEKGRFVYIPGSAADALRTGEATHVGFKSIGWVRWQKHALYPFLLRIENGEESLFPANMVDWEEWLALGGKVLGLELNKRENGHLNFSDGSVVSYISTQILIGKKTQPRVGEDESSWSMVQYGWLLAVEERYPPERVTRIAHLMEEFLHQVRNTDPATIIRAAKFLDTPM